MWTRAAALGASALAVLLSSGIVGAQTNLPTVTVVEPKARKPKPARVVPRRPAVEQVNRSPSLAKAAPRRIARASRAPVAPRTAPAAPAVGPGEGGPAAAQAAALANTRAGEAEARATRERLLPNGPGNATSITKETIDNLPAGNNTPFDAVLLQLPGAAVDAAALGLVRRAAPFPTPPTGARDAELTFIVPISFRQ